MVAWKKALQGLLDSENINSFDLISEHNKLEMLTIVRGLQCGRGTDSIEGERLEACLDRMRARCNHSIQSRIAYRMFSKSGEVVFVYVVEAKVFFFIKEYAFGSMAKTKMMKKKMAKTRIFLCSLQKCHKENPHRSVKRANSWWVFFQQPQHGKAGKQGRRTQELA